ncbi:GntR family transcriptional regulator [Ralstonia solanacearum]|uniref:Transcriptional regulator, GntR family n=1 Tax=Ralstonia solanacearum (strain Po82) TaxID=1031711 RepID=F6G6E5_RALS8|nr:GntR family transcriptional regulator [Ralstonia solanacearum]AEG67490.1 Transcriptional regulator, GntR family [Ralstonia solanacearum Po82]AMP68891.1 GntR family transcriptional regulator [Ralstonia solanacearum]AMP74203.1 GntR family transcriptional regulator [Ralstonia solanacearum]EUJ16335.1 GntR family transcriptional regulator [Ralstonia solanacearum P673]MBB6586007.1 GntR family transcriptional regulator [Ralstonia solanacearum]
MTEDTHVADISSEGIADDIAQAIVAHRLPPGTKLREEALARVYRVSRTKIRAALLMLAKDKLIRIEPDRGAFVAKPDETEAREVFAVRRVLEVALVREFIARATPADYARLEQHLAEEHEVAASTDVPRRNRLMADFHLLMADVVGNSVLKEMLRELSARSSVITMMYQSTYDAVRSSDEHTAFLEAAKRGDVDGAIALMDEHMAHTEASLHFTLMPPGETDLVTALLA